MIVFTGVGKRFRGRHRTKSSIALHDVNLDIPAGATWGVVGPNGAGKSTLFAVLLGFLKPTSGTIRIDDLEPRDYNRAEGAGYLPERFRLPPDWTVGAALEALAALDGVSEPAARADAALAEFHLLEQRNQTVGTLSRGTLQRVGLAQAFLAGRNLIVLDEPTEGLDPLWRLRFRERITQRAKFGLQHVTILMASHDLAEVERLVDHVVLLDQGSIRDSFDITAPAGAARRYRIALQAPAEDVSSVLGQAEAADAPHAWFIHVRDAHELNARLAALLAVGALIESVTPAHGLEERVRAAFRNEPSS